MATESSTTSNDGDVAEGSGMGQKLRGSRGFTLLASRRLLPVLITTTLLSVFWADRVAWAQDVRPNIIFILADDQSWNGTSVQMHPGITGSKSDFYRTPNLEKLADSGMRFSSAYAPGPMCSPTRASLQTGKSPAQLQMTNVGRSRPTSPSQRLKVPPFSSTLSTQETTIGEVLQANGYATAWFGKWHLGGNQGPAAHGYDQHDGATGNNNGDVDDPNNPKDIFGITRRGLAFMEECVQQQQPFYLQLWHYAVHSPIQARPATVDSNRRRKTGRVHQSIDYAAMTEDLDASLGMVLEKLEELQIAEQTYLVYMSDHGAGGRSSNAPLRAGKGTLWEGGVRVPLIIQGPGVQSRAVCDTPTVGWDLFPTFCDWAGIREGLPRGVEGASLKGLCESGVGNLERPNEGIVLHYPHYRERRGGRSDSPHSTLLLGNYKLVKLYDSGQLLLFDLENDISEQQDLSANRPKLASRMDRLLVSYLKNVDAGVPELNPDYRPDAEPASGRRRNRRRTNRGR